MEPRPLDPAAPSPAAAAASLEALAELVAVVDRLRDPETGCPWDLEQTHASLVPYVLEEAHEVADAIRHGDDRHLAEELGDLLLQVVLHARIASEAGRFDLEQIARGISAKLIRRHPHVFEAAEGEQQANRGSGGDSAAVRRRWESIKAEAAASRRRPGEGSPSGASASPPQRSARRQGARTAAPGRCHDHLPQGRRGWLRVGGPGGRVGEGARGAR